MFKFKKDRNFVISYHIISNKLNKKGFGHTYRKEQNGKPLDFNDWHSSTTEYWNEKWETEDVGIIVTNIFENK